MEKRYYLAYGSNLNVWQMTFRCPSAKVIGTGILSGYELLFKGSKTGSHLTIEPKEGSRVSVAVWTVTKNDEARLDRYEGFPIYYYIKEIELPVKSIKSGKIRKLKTFVYIMHEDRPLVLPSSCYLQTCCEGYGDFGFDSRFLVDAYVASYPEVRK